MWPPCSPRRPSTSWRPPPRRRGMLSCSGCCKRNGSWWIPSWRTSTARPFPPPAVVADGHDPITVASRFGTLHLTRQVLAHRDGRPHVLPGNAVLPAHHGMIVTRGLQEWACLLPQELPFASVERLLGWQTQDAEVLSASTVRTLVRRHGHLIRQAEQAEAAALLAREDLSVLTPVVVPHQPTRR